MTISPTVIRATLAALALLGIGTGVATAQTAAPVTVPTAVVQPALPTAPGAGHSTVDATHGSLTDSGDRDKPDTDGRGEGEKSDSDGPGGHADPQGADVQHDGGPQEK